MTRDGRDADTCIVGRDAAETRFVDRVAEFHRLISALDDAAAGNPSLILLGGDAGVGKTRLLAEFAANVDALVLRGGCLPLGERGLPFAPVVDVLRGLIAGGLVADVPPALARLVPGAAADPAETPGGQAHLFSAFLDLLERLSADRTVAVILEDPPMARTVRHASCCPSPLTTCVRSDSSIDRELPRRRSGPRASAPAVAR